MNSKFFSSSKTDFFPEAKKKTEHVSALVLKAVSSNEKTVKKINQTPNRSGPKLLANKTVIIKFEPSVRPSLIIIAEVFFKIDILKQR